MPPPLSDTNYNYNENDYAIEVENEEEENTLPLITLINVYAVHYDKSKWLNGAEFNLI